MPLSPYATGGSSVNSTSVASPLLNATPVTLTLSSAPATLNALAAGAAPLASSASLKVSVNVAPFTDARATVGAALNVPLTTITSAPDSSRQRPDSEVRYLRSSPMV